MYDICVYNVVAQADRFCDAQKRKFFVVLDNLSDKKIKKVFNLRKFKKDCINTKSWYEPKNCSGFFIGDDKYNLGIVCADALCYFLKNLIFNVNNNNSILNDIEDYFKYTGTDNEVYCSILFEDFLKKEEKQINSQDNCNLDNDDDPFDF